MSFYRAGLKDHGTGRRTTYSQGKKSPHAKVGYSAGKSQPTLTVGKGDPKGAPAQGKGVQ